MHTPVFWLTITLATSGICKYALSIFLPEVFHNQKGNKPKTGSIMACKKKNIFPFDFYHNSFETVNPVLSGTGWNAVYDLLNSIWGIMMIPLTCLNHTESLNVVLVSYV